MTVTPLSAILRPMEYHPLFRFRKDVVYRSLDEQHFLLSADSAFHTVSDPVGGFILGYLKDAPPRSLDEIVTAVGKEFDTKDLDVPSDVGTFLDDLLSREVLERIVLEDKSES